MFLGCFVLWSTKKVCMNCFILLLCERHYSTQDREAALNTAKQAAAFIWKTLHKIKMEKQFVFFYNDFDTSLQLYFLKILERKNFILQLIWNLNCFFMAGFVWESADFLFESQADILQNFSAVTDIYTVFVLWLWQCYAAAVLDQPLFFWELSETTIK